MFTHFNKNFESFFRIFFIIWASVWAVINILGTLFQYLYFLFTDNNRDNIKLLSWFLDTSALIFGSFFGILLIVFMINIGKSVKNKKPITNLPILYFLTILYYTFVTLVQTINNFLFKGGSVEIMVFTIAWFLPSFILMIVHIIYLVNIDNYNNELGSKLNN